MIDGSEKRNRQWLLNFRIRMFVKRAVIKGTQLFLTLVIKFLRDQSKDDISFCHHLFHLCLHSPKDCIP